MADTVGMHGGLFVQLGLFLYFAKLAMVLHLDIEFGGISIPGTYG